MTCKKKKAECKGPECEWIVGTGCRPVIQRPVIQRPVIQRPVIQRPVIQPINLVCKKKKKAECKGPECKWIVGTGCRPKSQSQIGQNEVRQNPLDARSRISSSSQRASRGLSREQSPVIYDPEEKRVRPVQSKNCIERSILKPLPHQIDVIRWLDNNRGIIAIHNVGSGKTLTSVISSQCFLDKNPNSKVLVISPKSLISNFKKEMIKYGLDENDNRYIFYSFEKFARLHDSTKEYKKLCEGNFLIIDEAHILRTKVATTKLEDDDNINSPSSLSISSEHLEEKKDEQKKGKISRSTLIVNCAKMVKKILLLTATPFVNETFDLANLLAMVKGENPLSYKEWEKMMGNEREKKGYFKNCISFFNSSRNEYPRRIDHTEMIEMDRDFYREYKKIEEKNEEALERYLMGTNPESFLSGFRTALLKLPDSAKIKFAIEKINQVVGMNKKIVIYSNFINAGINIISEFLNNSHIPYGSVTGKLDIKKRKEAIDMYNSGDVKVLLLSKAGGVGLDLQETHTMVVIDIPWNMSSLEQAIGRVVRFRSHINLPPNERFVHIYVLYCVKPRGFMRNMRDGLRSLGIEIRRNDHPSVDIIMKNILERKLKEEIEFNGFLKKISI